MQESHLFYFVIAVIIISILSGFFISCKAGSLLLDLCGGEQKFMTDRVVEIVHESYALSLDMIDRVYGETPAEQLPPGVMVCLSRKTGTFCCTYDSYQIEGRAMKLTGSYTLRERSGILSHTMKLQAQEGSADPVDIDISMRVSMRSFGQLLYSFSHCRVNGFDYPTAPLEACRIGADRVLLDAHRRPGLPPLPSGEAL